MPLIAGVRVESVGGYALERPVLVGVRESVWAARGPAGDACAVELWERFDETPASGEALDAFVERGALQRRVAAAGGGVGNGLGRGHVVGVRALEATDFGAMLARDLYGVSAAELVAGKVRLRADALHEIVSGVVAGLRVFREKAGRPHGALDAGAVLVSDDPAGKRRVGLRAPATAGELAAIADPDGDELRRLGLLIFELVLHRPFRAMGGYPVRDGSEWQAMGKAGAFWLGLVNELLAPSGCRATLDEVAARIDGLAFRVDKPGAGVWLGRAGIAAAVLAVAGAGVWFGFRPRATPPRADYRDAELERWLRVTPFVASLREEVGGMDRPPAVLVEALGRLDVSGDPAISAGDVFDVPLVFEEARLDRRFAAAFGRPLPELISEMRDFALEDMEARAITQEESEDQRRLEELAYLFGEGLKRYGVEPEAGADDAGAGEVSAGGGAAGGEGGESDIPSLLDSFDGASWPALGVIEGLVEGEGVAWFRPSASALFESRLDRVREGLATLEAGADESMGFDEATAREPVVGGVSAVVGGFVEAVETIERTAGVVGVWRDELYPRIESGSEAIAAGADWPATPGGVGARLPGDGDRFLRSFAEFADRVGVVGDNEDDEDLGRRLEAAADAVDRVRAVVESGWDAESVDLLAHAAWLESARARIEATPAESDGAALAAWIDARIELSADWVASVESSAPVAAGEAWPVAAFGDRLDETRGKWDEATTLQPTETREAETEFAGGAGVVGPALEEIGLRLEAVRAMPRWASLRAEVDAASRELEAEFDALAGTVDRIYAEVLQPPRELIAFWRESPYSIDGFDSAALASARESIGERYAGAWEDWAAGSGLSEDDQKRAPESDRLRVALRSVDEAVARAAERVRGVLAEDRSYGAFDAGAVESVAGAWMAARFAERLGSIEGWDDKQRVGRDGAVMSAVDELAGELSATLDGVAADLAGLSESSALVARGYTLDDSAGGMTVGDRSAVASRNDRLRADGVPPVGEIPRVERAMLVMDGLLGIEAIDDAGRLLDAFVSEVRPEAQAEGRAGIGVEAIERLDALGRDAGAWPASVDAMLSQRSAIAEGVAALRAGLSESDWAAIGGRLEPVVQQWWLRGVGSAGDRSAFARAVEGAGDWFDGVGGEWDGLLGAELLEGRSRFNARVIKIRSEIDGLAADAMASASTADADAIPRIDSALQAGVREKLDEVRRLASQTLGDDEARRALGWVADFTAELDEARGGRRGWDEQAVGPVGAGIAGWSAVLDEDAEPPRVVYSYDPGRASDAVSIEFRLISDLLEGGQVFLAVDEVSVDVFGAMLRGTGDELADRLENLMFAPVAGQLEGNMVEGPATRALTARRGGRARFRVRPREKWLEGGQYGPPDRTVSFPAYPAGLVGDTPADIAPSQGEPDGAHPVNYVNDRIAFEMSEAFGCRLPTAEEFRAAMSMPGVPAVRSGRWNLRDSSFRAQFANFQAALQMEVTTHYEPGKWSYDGTNGANDADWGIAGGDDRLWFYKTGAGVENGFQDGILFRHLIGNVAEYVLLDESVRDSGGVRIMGASALSDPAVAPGDALEGTGSRNGYVDVGFRLAIDADDFGSLGKMVRKQLASSEAASFVAGDG